MEEKAGSDMSKVVAPPIWGSCRLAAALMCCVASFGALLMTMNLGMVIVCMNKASHGLNNGSATDDDQAISNCTNLTLSDSAECPTVTEEGYWDKREQGLLLGATYYGVVSMQLLVGWLSDKYGKTKLKMIIGSAVMGLANLLAPVIIMNLGVSFFFAVRVLMGAGMCFVLSPVLVLLGRWSTSREQGLLVGLSFAGVGLANSLTYPVSGLLCEYCGWRSIFYFAGAFGLLWSILALFVIYDTPHIHPRVDATEKQYLLASKPIADSSKIKEKKIIPWTKILLSVPVWSVITTNVFFFGATKGTSMTLPLFVRDVLDFTVTENGIFSALPSVAALIIHLIIGPLFDHARAKNYFSTTVIRKIFHAIGTVIPGILMFAVSQLPPEQKYLIMGLITIGYSLYEVAWMGGFSFCLLDLAPDFVGILQGINNTIGLAPGFIMPSVISALTQSGTSEEWSRVFLMFGGLYMAAFLTYTVTGSSSLQSWGKVQNERNNGEKTEEKLIA